MLIIDIIILRYKEDDLENLNQFLYNNNHATIFKSLDHPEHIALRFDLAVQRIHWDLKNGKTLKSDAENNNSLSTTAN